MPARLQLPAHVRVNGSTTALFQLLEFCESMMRFTPLMACIFGAQRRRWGATQDHFVNTANVLIEAGANVNAKNVIGETALAKCLNGITQTPSGLLDSSIGPVSGELPTTAVYETVMLLGKHNADPNLANRFGETLIKLAAGSGYVKTATILMELGAEIYKDGGVGTAMQIVHAGCVIASKAIRELLAVLVWKEGGCVGKRVVVTVFTGAACDLNGKVGTVQRLDPEKGKYEVEVDDNGNAMNSPAPRIVVIPPRRLVLAKGFVGGKVKLLDLVGRGDLNGSVGDCVQFLAPRGRYEVRLHRDGEKNEESIVVKPSNLQRLESGTRAATTCFGCGKAPGKATKLKYCTGCYCVSYCGKTCSKLNWEKHKPECKARAENQVRVDIVKIFLGLDLRGNREAQDIKDAPSLFVVKVQINPEGNDSFAASVKDESKETEFMPPRAMTEQYRKVHVTVETLGISCFTLTDDGILDGSAKPRRISTLGTWTAEKSYSSIARKRLICRRVERRGYCCNTIACCYQQTEIFASC